MTATALYHGIHTNAFGEGGRGFRTLFVVQEGPAADADRIGRWLQTLRPDAAAAHDGFAANCFRLGNVIYAVLARIDGGFARDEYGREGGLLVHALFAELSEDRPPGHFGLALLDMARSFERPAVDDAQRLDLYLEQCRRKESIEIPPVDPAALLSVDPLWLGSLFVALTMRAQAGTAELGIPVPEEGLPDAVVRAGMALPPRLRLSFRWGVGIRPVQGVSFLVRESGAPSGPGAGGTSAGGYLDWLQKRLQAGQMMEVRSIVESWNVHSWDGLLETIARY